MRNQVRTLTTALFAAGLLLLAGGCGKKKTGITSTPPPPTTNNGGGVSEPPPSGPLAVRINNFTVEPRSIERGQSATLRWSVANATDIQLDKGLGAISANGSRQVFPSTTTTYTLSAKNSTGSNETRSVTVEVAGTEAPPAPPPPVKDNRDIRTLVGEMQDAYFDYDSNDLRADARDAMTKDATLLKQILAQDPNFTILIEGHCDERGSAEYNDALGDRRARVAKDFLEQLGVPGNRIKLISYGKEKPQCTDPSEACYQKNRRAHPVTQ